MLLTVTSSLLQVSMCILYAPAHHAVLSPSCSFHTLAGIVWRLKKNVGGTDEVGSGIRSASSLLGATLARAENSRSCDGEDDRQARQASSLSRPSHYS